MRLRTWGMIGIASALGAGVGAWSLMGSRPKPQSAVVRAPSASKVAADSSVAGLARGASQGNAGDLITLKGRFDAEPGDLADWVGIPACLRTGFPRFGGGGKTSSLELASGILTRFGKSAAPPEWSEILDPSRALFTAGLSDADPSIRACALRQIGTLWTWVPDRTLIPIEEDLLASWKTRLHADVVRRLHDDSPLVRAGVASCLAALPLDDQASPALVLARDDDPFVRAKVLLSFANRPDLLSVEEILPMLYDRVEIADVAVSVLKARGLTLDQINLAKMLAHPKPGVRASAIPLLLKRDEIDPTVWLIYLSRDADDSVRAGAVAAFEGRIDPDSRARLREIATSDPSPSIREIARKLLPTSESTASLPALPGSRGLNLRGN